MFPLCAYHCRLALSLAVISNTEGLREIAWGMADAIVRNPAIIGGRVLLYISIAYVVSAIFLAILLLCFMIASPYSFCTAEHKVELYQNGRKRPSIR